MGDVSAQIMRQLSFMRIVERGDMPPGWMQGREAPIAHRERTGHRLAACEEDDGTGKVICEACQWWWVIGRRASLVDEQNAVWADRHWRNK